MSASEDFTTINYDEPFFAMSTAGFIIPMITGTLSALCSLLILYIISKSSQKLSTTHHRIMSFMSIFDFVASACMALSTLPMPRDIDIPFKGPRLGNHTTCQMQGYFMLLGMVGGGCLYSVLSWYFVLTITFKVSLDKIRRLVEPVFYIYVAIVAIFVPSFFLAKDLIHSDFYEPFCVIAPEYYSCYNTLDTPLNCMLRIDDYSDFLKSLVIATFLVAINFVSVIVAMLLILFTVHQRTKDLKEATSCHGRSSNQDDCNPNEDNSDTNENLIRQTQYSRVVIVQALLYIFSYMITWAFMITSMIDIKINRSLLNILDTLKVTLFPMQGVWNLIIFVYDKSCSIKMDDPSKSWSQAVIDVFSLSGFMSDILLTNISFLSNNPVESLNIEQPVAEASDPQSIEDCYLSQIGSVYDGVSNTSPSFHHSTALSSEGVSITYMYTPEFELKNVRKKFHNVDAASECSSS